MRSASLLEKHLKSRVKFIAHMLRSDSEEFSPEDIHVLRVELKRILSVAELLKSVSGKHGFGKLLAPFRRIFRAAGKVRSAQLEISFIRQFQLNRIDAAFIKAIERRIKKRERNFRAKLKKGVDRELKESGKKLMRRIRTVKEKEVDQVLRSFHKSLIKLLKTSELSDDELHELRKEIKTRNYLFSAVYGAGLADAHLDRIQKELGEWHDLLQFRKRLFRLECSPEVSEKDIELIRKTQEALMSELHRRRTLIDRMRQAYSPVL